MTRRGYAPSCSSALLTIVCLTLCHLGFPAKASAATQTLTVTNTNDSGAGSLRTAITTANGDTGDTINITATGIITLASSLPALAANMTITGPGAASLTVSGNNSSTVGSIFTINSGVTVSISSLTIANGNAPGGGGIFSEGTLMLTNCTVENNTAAGPGGTAGLGGGIDNDGGTVTVTNSTISGNTATGGGEGGGIDNDDGPLTVVNSTISGNSATGSGSIGGGIANGGASPVLSLANSIVAGNSASTYADIDGSYADNGGNKASNSSSGTSTIAIDLAPLGNYGGPTQTMPPLTGSPALNAGTYQTGEPTTDQRGAPRPSTSGATIDSGSVQISGEPPLVLSVTPNNGSTAGGTSVTITGTGLDAATAVKFGSTSAASFTLNAGSSTSLSTVSATSPAANAGTVDITVANSSGTSATGSNDKFTYWTPLEISPSGATLNTTYGTTFSQTFTVTGGSDSYTLSNTGTPPAGLTLGSSATGWTLNGTPTSISSSSLALTAVDKTYSSNTTTQNYTVAVGKATPVISNITQPTLSFGQSGTISITLAPPSPGPGVNSPTGTITYSIDGGSSQTATLSSGVASLSVPSTLTTGSHSFVWSYGGDTNYTSLTSQTITQNIGAATLTIVVNSFSRLYGAANPTLTGTVTGYENGDTATSVGLAYSTTATTSSPVGTYSITATITSTNYTLNVTQGTLTVTAAPLTVAVNNASRAYGTTNPAFSGTPTGLVNGDTAGSIGLAYSTMATAASPVSTYPITATIASTNYTLTVMPGTLTVTAVPLTVAVNNASRSYGAANPAFSGTVTGLVNNDTATSIGLAYSTTATAASPVSTYPITASITSANYTLTVTPGTLTISQVGTSVKVSSSVSSSAVNQQVVFTAVVAPASGTGTLTGTVTFIDTTTGNTLCSGYTLTNGQTNCLTSSLTAGTQQTIQATYSGDSNSTTSSGTVTQTVNADGTSTAVTSSLNPSIVSNIKGYNDQVTLTATVIAANSGPIALSSTGVVNFTDNNSPLACSSTTWAVSGSKGVATCKTIFQGSGQHSVAASYANDPNFAGSTSTPLIQLVQGYTLIASVAGPITITQGFTNTTDPFSPQPVTVTAQSLFGFTGSVTLACTAAPITAPSGAVPPACTSGAALPITSSGGGPVPITIDAGSGSASPASPGLYQITVTGVDSMTGLIATTQSFSVNVIYRSQSAAVAITSGTSGTGSVTFQLPAGVGLSSFQCPTVGGPTLASTVAASSLFLSCTQFNPSSVASSTSMQTASVSVTVNTNGATTAKLDEKGMGGTIVVAGLLGIPILVLLGFMPGGKSSRKIFLRYLAIAFVLVTVLQGVGCGGGSFTRQNNSTINTTPVGQYYLLVQGKGTDGNTYEAVLNLAVTR